MRLRMARSTVAACLLALAPAAVIGTLWSLHINSFAAFVLVAGAIVVGPYMAVAYPFPLLEKVTLVVVFLSSVVAVSFGLKFRQKRWGLVLVGFGSTAWLLGGLVGLGTGT